MSNHSLLKIIYTYVYIYIYKTKVVYVYPGNPRFYISKLLENVIFTVFITNLFFFLKGAPHACLDLKVNTSNCFFT